MKENASVFTRRELIVGLGGLPLASLFGKEELEAMPWNEPAIVAKVFVVSPTVHWPKPDLDVQKDVAEVEARLAEVERKNAGQVRFTGGEVLRKDEEVEPWRRKYGDADAVLIFPMSAPPGPLTALVNSLDVPALYLSRPYAGHAWSWISAQNRAGKKIDVVATSSYGDLDPYMPVFRTIRHLKRSKVLVVAMGPRGRETSARSFSEQFGTAMRFLTYDDLKAAFESADARQAQQAAEDFTRGALRVAEPKPKEIQDALRFYLGVAGLLRKEKANAITVDCFGGLLAGRMPAYPCIAWSKLNDAGMYGVCEGDIYSTMTQMLVTSHSGMPGFVSDPVFDLSRDEVIHAHCVAATKMKGIDGPASPYIIRNNLETNEGAVLQVLMPVGETVTVGVFSDPAKFLVSTAEVTGVVDSDRGCRSQIRTRVSDAKKMLAGYSGGLHRVIFYGDHVPAIERMGRLMGFRVTREI